MSDDVKVRELRVRPAGPNEEAVEMARKLLAQCEAGETLGFVALTADVGGLVGSVEGGDRTAPDMFYAFECWKHRVLHRKQAL